jgi:hypothetical protein
MPHMLVKIAAVGLGAGVLLLSTAALLSGGRMAMLGLLPEAPGSQDMASRDFTWDGGDSLDVSTSATVHLVPGQTPRVTIRAPRRALDRVRFHDGTLDLSGSNFFYNDHLDVTIAGVLLRDITLDGSGKIFLGTLHQDRLSVDIQGSGDVEGSGQVDSASLEVAGSGRMRLGQLIVSKARIDIAGSGNVAVDARDQADVEIAGSGSVRFPGTPKKLSSQISGSGRVLNGSGPDAERN